MKNKSLCLVLALVCCLILAGCGSDASHEQTADQLVKTVQVGSAEAGSTAGTYAGSVKGRYESNLSFQAGGRITARNVQLGSVVHAGDVLMTVNPQDVAQAVNQTKAQVSAAEAQLNLAKSNLARYQQLYAQDAVSAAALDQYTTAYNQAQAQYDQAVAAMSAQENQLSYTQLTADADGVISAVTGEVGQVVAAGQTVLTLVHDGDLEVQINVPENHVADFPTGKEVSATFWALNDQPVRGVVREVAPMADAASRTYKVSITLPDPPAGLQLGMTASVTNDAAAAATGASYVLPLSAVYQTGDTPQVFVVGKDKILKLVPVQVEKFGDNSVSVTGLQAGDEVVTAGVHMLHDGQRVRTERDET